MNFHTKFFKGALLVSLGTVLGSIWVPFACSAASPIRTLTVTSLGAFNEKAYPWSADLNISVSVTKGSVLDPKTVAIDTSGSTAENCHLSSDTLTPTLSATSSGVCSIKVTISGSSYQPASGTQVFTFRKAIQSLAFNRDLSQTIYVGDSINFSSQLSHQGSGLVTLSTNSSSCNVSNLIVSASNSLSNCLISASIEADSVYESATSSNNVTLRVYQFRTQEPIVAVTLNYSSKNYPYSQGLLSVKSITGGSGSGRVSITGVSNGTASGCAWNESILSASTPGTCVLTITKAQDSSYLSASGTAIFNFFSSEPLSISPCSVSNGASLNSPAINISGCTLQTRVSDLSPQISQATVSTVMGGKILTITGINLGGVNSLLLFTAGSGASGKKLRITSNSPTTITASVPDTAISKIQISTSNGVTSTSAIG